jgi:cyclic pyranopterin phosphate synthase
MLLDSYNRNIDYMRLSVTDRCNLCCSYCMPEEGVRMKAHNEILAYEEIERFANAAVKAGISKIRLTGGEPLVRRDIVSLVGMLANIDGIEDLALTTNGILLSDYGEALKDAGLMRVNISLDSFDPATYEKLTRCGDLERAMAGLRMAIELGFEPVKVNVVLIKGVNDDPGEFIKLIYDYPVHVRFIELMPVSVTDKGSFLSIAEFETKIAAYGEVENIDNTKEKLPIGAGPARYITLKGALGTIGFISAVSNHFCNRCNRIRLTPDGKLRTCLFSETEFDIRKLLRANVSEEGLVAFIKNAVLKKPEQHNIGMNCDMKQGTDIRSEKRNEPLEQNRQRRSMSQIGG